MKKKIDLSGFAGVVDDSLIRKTFFNDNDLMIVYCMVYQEDVITIPQLHRKYNRLRGTGLSKAWVYTKLYKIDNYGLISRRRVSECTPNGSSADSMILEKHKQWAAEAALTRQLHPTHNEDTYYFLTEKGLKWIDWISEELKRRSKLE